METAPRYMLLTLILLLTWFRKIKIFDNLFHDLPKTSLESFDFFCSQAAFEHLGTALAFEPKNSKAILAAGSMMQSHQVTMLVMMMMMMVVSHQVIMAMSNVVICPTKLQGDFFNWASPGFAKCWTVSN